MSKSVRLLLLCVALLLVAVFAQAVPHQEKPLKGAKAEGFPTQGVVIETMNDGGYTFLCLEKEGKQLWVVVRETQIFVGQEVEVSNGPVKRNFTSKNLDRTFDAILFSRGLINR
jgi:hypothetical protein